MAAGQPGRAAGGAAALPRPVRAARPPHAGRGRPARRVVQLRARRGQDRGRRRLGRRLEAGLLRLGVQGQAQGPRRRLRRSCCEYREALENPPLLVVCDMDRIEIHTNFTNTAAEVHDDRPRRPGRRRAACEILRAVFFDPETLRPGRTSEAITEEAARRVAELADALRERGLEPHAASPTSSTASSSACSPRTSACCPPKLFTPHRWQPRGRPAALRGDARRACSRRWPTAATSAPTRSATSTATCSPTPPSLELTADEIAHARRGRRAATGARSSPSIFGTLFERGLDPAKRSQLGAHYTSREDIETLVEPVVMAPLRREWDEARATVASLLTTGTQKAPAEGQAAVEAAAARRRAARPTASCATSSTGSPTSRCSTPPAAPATSSTSRCRSCKDLEKEVIALRRGARPRRPLPARRPAAAPRHRDQPLRLRPGADDRLDRLPPVDAAATASAGPPTPSCARSTTFGCMDAILDLSDPDAPEGARLARGRLHRRQPAVPGRQAPAHANSATTTSSALFALWDGPRSRARPTSAATGSRRPARRSRPASARAPACSPPRASAAAPTARS